jgi:predicted tellurium resistance membrane protein TerC
MIAAGVASTTYPGWFGWMVSPEAWIALISLTALEIVLGVDNIIFISILADNLPEENQNFARRIGLGLALGARLVMLFGVAWIMSLTDPIFALLGETFSIRDFIMIGGGMFLLAKSTTEIHDNLEGDSSHGSSGSAAKASLASVLVQIMILDGIFSIDSVITAIGLVEEISIIAIAMVTAMIVMIVSVNKIGDFIQRHPSFKMLALSFLVTVGVILTVEGFGIHVPKGYIYFAMAFSAGVEVLNMQMRKSREEPLHLKKQPESGKSSA